MKKMTEKNLEEKNAYRRIKEKAFNKCIPISAQMELTFRCNHDCVFCYNTRDDEAGKEELALPEYHQALKKLKELQVLFVTLTGGEPLCRKDFFEIAQLVRSEGFALRIFTNGYLIDRTMADRIKRLMPFEVEISIHGDNAKTHERVTQLKGSFQKIMEAIDFLKERKIKVNLKSMITTFNQEEIKGIIDIAEKKGCSISFDPVLSPKDNGEKSPLNYLADREHLQKFWTEIYPGLRGSSLAPLMEDDCVWAICGIGRSSIAMDPYGNLFPCVQWREKIANIKEVSSMKELWEKSTILKRVRSMAIDIKEKVIDKAEFGHFYSYCPGIALKCTGDAYSSYPQAIENARDLFLAYQNLGKRKK